MASSGNYSLLAVPAHFGIAMMVHLLKQGMIVAAGMRVNNVDPRTNVDRAAKKMTPAQHRRLARVTAAHNNLLEGLPLFAAGIVGIQRKVSLAYRLDHGKYGRSPYRHYQLLRRYESYSSCDLCFSLRR